MARRMSKLAVAPRLRPPKGRRPPDVAAPYPTPPRELAGKWVAWSRRRIIASGDVLDDVVAEAERSGAPGISYERLPRLERVR